MYRGGTCCALEMWPNPREVLKLQKQDDQCSPYKASKKWQDPGKVLTEELVQTHGKSPMPCVKWPHDSCAPE